MLWRRENILPLPGIEHRILSCAAVFRLCYSDCWFLSIVDSIYFWKPDHNELQTLCSSCSQNLLSETKKSNVMVYFIQVICRPPETVTGGENATVYSTESVVIRPHHCVNIQRLQRSYWLDNHWPWSGYTFHELITACVYLLRGTRHRRWDHWL
jgi:hypothetical protein